MSKRERVLGWIENECKRYWEVKRERGRKIEMRREGEKSGRLLGA